MLQTNKVASGKHCLNEMHLFLRNTTPTLKSLQFCVTLPGFMEMITICQMEQSDKAPIVVAEGLGLG